MRAQRSRLVVIGCWALGGSISPASETSAEPRWVFGPQATSYPVVVADLHRPRLRAALMAVAESGLGDRHAVGDARIALDAAARIPFFRYGTAQDPRRPGTWQFDLDAGIFSQFDAEHQLDSIGWDGWLAAHASYRARRDLAFKFAYRHVSAHRGDEFVERTGAERIGYTREDLSLTAAWRSPAPLTLHAEVAYAVTNSAAFQKPWLIQLATQHRELRDDESGYEWGLEARWYQEDEWEATLTARAAWLLPMSATGRHLALDLSIQDGRSALAEFARFEERTLTLGLAMDF